MKKLLSFITAFLIMGSLCVSADTVEPAYYVQGHFFKDMPKNLPEGYSLSFISYGEGKRLILIVYKEAVTLPEDIVNSAIPEEQLANLDLIWPAVTSSLQFVSIMDESIKNRETLTLGSAFPKFTAVDIDGVECGSKDIEGKVMVLNLWYTGCGPCRKEMPELSKWREKYPDVVFLSSTWETANIARPVLEKCGFTWRHIVNDRQFLKWLNGRGFPMTIVVDKQGIVRHYENGSNPEKLASILQAIETACNDKP